MMGTIGMWKSELMINDSMSETAGYIYHEGPNIAFRERCCVCKLPLSISIFKSV